MAHIWRGNKHPAPVMQANRLILGISNFLSYAIYHSFYVDYQITSRCSRLPEAENFTLYYNHFTTTPTTASINIGNSALNTESYDVTHTSVNCSIQVTNASKSFFVVGFLYLLIPGLIWGVGSLLAIVSKLPQASCIILSSSESNNRSEYQQSKSRRLLFYLFIGMLKVLVVLHAINFIMITSLFNQPLLALAAIIAYVAAIVTSILASSSKILACCLPLSILGAVMFTYGVSAFSDSFIYIGSLIVGFGLTPIIPACYAWTNEVTGLSPTHSAIITSGAKFGLTLGPRILAALQSAFGYMSALYTIIACCVFQFAIVIFLLILVKWQLKKRRRI